MLQVSTTFYFVFWGYNYGLSNIWYMASWAFGLWLFSRFAPRLVSIRLVYDTLPAYLSKGNFNLLRRVSALVTIASFIAIFYVESYFCVDFLSILANPFGNTSTDFAWWALFLILTVLTVIYSLFGGLRRVIITDRWQISFAYLSIAIIFSYLLHNSFAFSAGNGLSLALLMLFLFGVLLYSNRAARNRIVVQAALSIGFCLLLATTILSFSQLSLITLSNVTIPGPFTQLREQWGWFTLMGFTILNLLWQFCDSSNYQRIAALTLTQDTAKATRDLQELIGRLIVVSPLTWGLGIVLGIGIRTANIAVPHTGEEYISLLSAIKNAALHGDIFALIAVLALSAALTSIMMETVDCALIAFMQCFLRDLVGDKVFRPLRIFMISVLMYGAVLLLALMHREYSEASILTVMAGAYSAMVVLAIPNLLRMCDVEVSDGYLIFGIVCGFTLTWIATFGPVSSLPWNVKLVLPLFAGPAGSALGALLGTVVMRRKHA
jgi:hypothetical protein